MANTDKGDVFFCPVCGAEITVLNGKGGDFYLHCCNVEMQLVDRSIVFYYCPECAAEVTMLRGEQGNLDLHCCNQPMIAVDKKAA